MNKEIYMALIKHLGESVPELRWIDFDEGQLNMYGERPPVDYPCCLIDIQYANCRDLDDESQLVTANIILKLAFTPKGETYSKAPKEVQERALGILDVVEKIHMSMQGETLEEMVSGFSRQRAVRTTLKNKLILFTVTYQTTFREM